MVRRLLRKIPRQGWSDFRSALNVKNAFLAGLFALIFDTGKLVYAQQNPPAAEDLAAQLRDIHTPEISGSIVAPGWLIVFLSAFVLAAMLMVFFFRRRRVLKWRVGALEECARIQKLCDTGRSGECLAACSKLLRRVVLALMPRSEVAALSGKEWVTLLDTLHGTKEFTEGPGYLLERAPYERPVDFPSEKIQPLLDLTEDFIRSARHPSVSPTERDSSSNSFDKRRVAT